MKYECMKPISAAQEQGTVKANMMKYGPERKGFIGVSFYDIKPAHFLSRSAESLEWTTKYCMVYCNLQKKMERLDFLRLNINDEYNFSMGDVDVADQLRNQYLFDHFLWKFKSWRPILICYMQLLTVNAYVCYMANMDIEGVDNKDGITH